QVPRFRWRRDLCKWRSTDRLLRCPWPYVPLVELRPLKVVRPFCPQGLKYIQPYSPTPLTTMLDVGSWDDLPNCHFHPQLFFRTNISNYSAFPNISRLFSNNSVRPILCPSNGKTYNPGY